MTKKLCSSCHEMLPRTAFHASKSQEDGLAVYCRPCHSQYQAQWRGKRREEVRITGIPFDVINPKIEIDSNGCWIWKGRLHEGGYAILSYRGVEVRVHLGYWTYLNGPKPEGMDLDHLCRVRHCVNPDHLELVSRKINLNRGSGNKGEINGRSKLTEEQARQIKMALADGVAVQKLADQFGVAYMTVYSIKRGTNWSWI